MEKVIKVYTQLNPPKAESEKVETQDLSILDTTSLTSVVEFMQKFQSDATFAPPTMDVMYDSEKYDLDIDSEEDFPSRYMEVEELKD